MSVPRQPYHVTTPAESHERILEWLDRRIKGLEAEVSLYQGMIDTAKAEIASTKKVRASIAAEAAGDVRCQAVGDETN